jgi:predicted RNA-binding Zn-ribbon protein involved in translation (DUF1610 family)
MSCPECKDKTTTYNASGKASIQDLRTTTVHGCPNCGTTIKIVGVGKAKEIVHVHTCSMETATVACCK